ncbi:MAG: glycosyltransferase family 4 protein [Saprospiraceae bacterium]|nr:glycosyltransferase family 4 protein [Saprospiraceae bacterium]
MRILLLSNSAWNIYNFRLGLIEALNDLGHEIYLSSPLDEFVSRIPADKYKEFYPVKHLTPRGQNPIKDLLLILELKKIFNYCNPDLILLFTIKPNIYGGIVSRYLEIPFVVNITGLGSQFTLHNRFGFIVQKLFLISLKKCKLALFHNQEDLDYFVEHKLLFPERVSVVNGSGVDVNRFRPEPRKSKDRLVFLFSGRLLREKGLGEYMEAAKILKEKNHAIDCYVLGPIESIEYDTDLKNEFDLARQNKDIFYFDGTHNVIPFLQAADVFVLPSYREGRSKAILEAMSMGLPIITCDVAGCRDVVVDGVNGYLVREQDPVSLYHAMDKMNSLSFEDRQLMGFYSRQFVMDKFEMSKVQIQYIQALKKWKLIG